MKPDRTDAGPPPAKDGISYPLPAGGSAVIPRSLAHRGGKAPERGGGRLLPMLVLATLLGGCVDFVDPVELGLARDTRIDVTLELVDPPLRTSCPAPALAGRDSVVLCVQATVIPGITRLGERLPVLDDTLWVTGVPLVPTQASDSVLSYLRRLTLPRGSLEHTPITATLPRIESLELRPHDIRWYPAARADPDTVPRPPGGGVRLHVDLPGGASTPRPDFQFWIVNVGGDTAVASYNAYGVPRPSYDFPAEVLAALGGSRFVGELHWQRRYSPPRERLQLSVYLIQRLRWEIVTR